MPIFADFMQEALKNKEKKTFLVPEGVEMVKIDYKPEKLVSLEIKILFMKHF